MNAAEVDRLARFEEDYWWHRARRTIVARILKRYPLGHNLRVLDVGCGAGGTSVVLNDYGSVIGVDFGAEATAAARGRGLEVAQMDAASLALQSESIDLAVALDVLEHLDDDVAAARELRRVLRPQGLLLVTVPAYQWMWSSHDVALGHRRRYRKPALVRALRAGGLDVLMSSYVMTAALPPAAAQRLAERLPGRARDAATSESGYVAVPHLVNEALSRVVGLDGYLAGRVGLPFGLTIVAVARRPAG